MVIYMCIAEWEQMNPWGPLFSESFSPSTHFLQDVCFKCPFNSFPPFKYMYNVHR